MAWLVDGANLGGRVGGAAGARAAAEVVRLLLVWARDRRAAVTVVFDGPAQPEVAEAYGALRVVWSGARSGDDVIVDRLRAGPGDRWNVVTADRELARRCRELGARVEAVDRFLTRIEDPRRRSPTPGQAEIETDKPPARAEEREYWRRIFLDDD